MFTTELRNARGWREALRLAIAACGIASILGSGGGLAPGFPDYTPCCSGPYASVEPKVRTVSVGDSVTFDSMVVFATPPVHYQWQRNGVDIGGATSASLVLTGVNLADDGAQYTVMVNAANGSASATALLQVSAYPPVVFEDGEFVPDNWSVAAIATPITGGPTATVTRSASGGNPDAYRSIRYDMGAAPSEITVFHTANTATHDPATQGAIVAIDASVDCLADSGGVSAAILLEQDGRRFTGASNYCTTAWTNTVAQASLRAIDFWLMEGPPCAAGATCPDFAASGAPLRLGFATNASTLGEASPVVVTQGVDNWRISIWRR